MPAHGAFGLTRSRNNLERLDMPRKRKIRKQRTKAVPAWHGRQAVQPEPGTVADPDDSTRRIAVTVNAAAPSGPDASAGAIDEAEVAAADRFARLGVDSADRRRVGYRLRSTNGRWRPTGQPLSVSVMDAHRELAHISRVVGMVSYRILDLIYSAGTVLARAHSRNALGRQACGEAKGGRGPETACVSLRFRAGVDGNCGPSGP